MNLKHCTRCRCSLDVGDEALATTVHGPLCVSCDMIIKGVDPWTAMQLAAIHKAESVAQIGGAK